MSNMKIVALIDHRARQEEAERAAAVQDLYAALQAVTQPLKGRIEALEREVQQLRANGELRRNLRASGLRDEVTVSNRDDEGR